MSPDSLLTVLVVDDDADVRLLLTLALEDADYAVVVAEDGGEALEYLTSGTADIMFTDLQMPVMTGVELFARLRARGLRLPVVFMSAGTNARATAVAYGADGYLAKPFDIDDLLRTVAGLIGTEGNRRRETRPMEMTTAPNPLTVVVINSNDDLLRLLGSIVLDAGFASITVHADEVGRTVEAIQELLTRHNPKVVVYDISPPYPPNWELFSSVRDAENLAGTGRQFVVTSPNKKALEAAVGATSAIELVGADGDRQIIEQAIRSAAAV